MGPPLWEAEVCAPGARALDKALGPEICFLLCNHGHLGPAQRLPHPPSADLRQTSRRGLSAL